MANIERQAKPLTGESLRDLANRLQDAYYEECENGECYCVTIQEHEERLATRRSPTLAMPDESRKENGSV